VSDEGFRLSWDDSPGRESEEEFQARMRAYVDSLPDGTMEFAGYFYDDRAVIEGALDVPRQSPN
jgi:hypothetical protein